MNATVAQHRVACRAARGTRAFTLIELLAAMAILALMMTMVFTVLAGSQRAWSLMETNTRIYENAQVALDVISRDLQSVVFCTETKREIPFYIGPTNAGSTLDAVRLGFVADTEPSTAAKAKACELFYQCYTQSGNADSYWLRRARVCNNETDWDFYGDTDATTASNWVSTDGSYQRVIDGVEKLAFVFFDSSDAVIAPGAGTYVTELPRAVSVTLTVFDPKLRSAPTAVRDRTKRTFTKMVFLRGRS